MDSRFRIGVFILAIAGTTFLASCTSKITEEQLAEMKRLRQQEQVLEQQIRAKEGEKSRLQSEVDARRAEVDKCNTKKQFVQSKLAQWPNVWPDWKDTTNAPTYQSTPRR